MLPTEYLKYKLAQSGGKLTGSRGPKVKRGAEILDGPYPKSFTDFIGQTIARSQIISSITASIVMKEPLDHMLLATGHPGVGKTTLGRLTASELGVGMVELSGLVTDKDAAAAIGVMEDGDVLFLDEVHRLVSHGKAKAEWLLTLLQDGELHLPTGVVIAPKITVIAATTDKERLPQTILDRFTIQPRMENYTESEGVKIALFQAKRVGFGGDHLPMPQHQGWLEEVARAAKNNPRRIGQLLSCVRDIAISSSMGNLCPTGYDISQALEWNGLTEDGITSSGQDYLVGLLAYGGTAGLPTIKALLNEEQLVHTERALIQEGYVEVTARGRSLTDYGTERALQLAMKRVGNAA